MIAPIPSRIAMPNKIVPTDKLVTVRVAPETPLVPLLIYPVNEAVETVIFYLIFD
jgi:hypothetical protein